MRGLETSGMEAEALVCVLGVGMDLCTVTGLGNPIWIQLRDGGNGEFRLGPAVVWMSWGRWPGDRK